MVSLHVASVTDIVFVSYLLCWRKYPSHWLIVPMLRAPQLVQHSWKSDQMIDDLGIKFKLGHLTSGGTSYGLLLQAFCLVEACHSTLWELSMLF